MWNCWKYAFAFVIVAVFCQVPMFCSAQNPSFINKTDKEILDHIVSAEGYDHRIRPRNHTLVNVTVMLLSLSSPDESSLKYEVEFLLHLRWTDYRLEFDDGGSHQYLNALMHVQKIWLPDTYFIKHGEFKTPQPDHMALKLFRNGTVVYIMRRYMVLNCQGNLKIFPFDNPKCPFAIESVSHEVTELELKWDENASLIPSKSLRRHNAYLEKNDTGECDKHHTWRGNYSCLRVLLVFTRDKSFYFSTVFVPGIVLVTSSFISFWLDVNAVPARVMIGVTTMLNFCTTTNSFRSTLPVVSNLTAMNLWDGVCMFFIYASMLEFVIANYLHRKLPKGSRPSSSSHQGDMLRPTATLSQVGRWCGSIESSQKNTSDSNDMSSSMARERVTEGVEGRAGPSLSVFAWLKRPQLLIQNPPSSQRISKNIDNVSRAVFPILFGLFVFGFFLAYSYIEPRRPENWNLSSEYLDTYE